MTKPSHQTETVLVKLCVARADHGPRLLAAGGADGRQHAVRIDVFIGIRIDGFVGSAA